MAMCFKTDELQEGQGHDETTAYFYPTLGFILVTIGAVRARAQNPHATQPGSINFVEGKAAIGTQALGLDSAGFVELGKGQALTTEAGKVEILLTPGVFLRVADNSSKIGHARIG